MRNFFGKRLGVPVWALALIVLVSIGIGGAGGSSSTGVSQEKYDTAVAEKEGLEEQLNESETAVIKANQEARSKLEAEFAQQKAAQDAATASLLEREKALTAAEAAKKANTITGDGVYEVGVDIQPGTWKTDGSGQSCYWQTSSKGGDILANGNVDGPVVVVIPASAFSFTSTRCGTWRKTG